MLFPSRFHEGIAGGHITLAFRRWRSARTKVGSRHSTPVGLIEIDAVDIVGLENISAGDARRAGYEALEGLVGFSRLA